MDFCRVSVEAHRFGGTIYIAGFLAELAASRAEELIQGLSHETRVLRDHAILSPAQLALSDAATDIFENVAAASARGAAR
jgi:hypothetical protein